MNKLLLCILCLVSFTANCLAEDNSIILSIDDQYLEKWDNNLLKRKELDKNTYKIAEFSRLKGGQTQFAYYLLEKPIANEIYTTCLIYEYYDSEMAVWLVNYSSEHQIIDSLEIFYDNAEGAWQTTAKLNKKTKRIELVEYDAYADPDVKELKYNILPTGKIEKINK